MAFPQISWGFPGGTVVKNPPANAGDVRDMGLIPGSGRSSGGGNGNPLQYSCLENSMDRGAWWAELKVGRAAENLCVCVCLCGCGGIVHRRHRGCGTKNLSILSAQILVGPLNKIPLGHQENS